MRIFLIILLVTMVLPAYADDISSLVLSDAEIKKLNKFFPTDDNEHLTWWGNPIAIHLALGKEKRLIFPSQVTVDIKGALTTEQLRLLNDDKSLYLTALKKFPVTRVFVTINQTGQVLLLDLAIKENASNAIQYIEIEKEQKSSKIIFSKPTTKPFNLNVENKINYVDIIRFAWQQSFSPEHLIKKNLSYPRVPMQTHQFVSQLVYGDKVIAVPQGSWSVGNYYVTSVFLRNKYSHETTIDIKRDICGSWQAATIYPYSHLKPYGNRKYDSTVLFLISKQPFGEAFGVCYGNA